MSRKRWYKIHRVRGGGFRENLLKKVEKTLLFDLLFQFKKLFRVEKINECDDKTVAEHFEGHDAGILAFSIQNVLDG